MEESKYLIELFSHRTKSRSKAYLWTKSPNFLDDIKSLEVGQELLGGVFLHFSTIQKDELLDLFNARLIYTKLTSLGVKCQIVKADHKTQISKQID